MQIEEKDILIDAQGIATFEINLTAPINGTYQGVFKVRTVLTPMQEIEANRDYRELLGPNAQFATTHIENSAFALAELRQRIVQYPPFWWDGVSKFPGSHIKDREIVQAVYEAAILSEIKFRDSLTKKHKESVEKLKKAIEKREEEERINKEVEEDILEQEVKEAKPKKKRNIPNSNME